MNRVQTLVIAFFALAWIGLVVILAVAPDIYDRTLWRRSGVWSDP